MSFNESGSSYTVGVSMVTVRSRSVDVPSIKKDGVCLIILKDGTD